jgi:hypothetical protein
VEGIKFYSVSSEEDGGGGSPSLRGSQGVKGFYRRKRRHSVKEGCVLCGPSPSSSVSPFFFSNGNINIEMNFDFLLLVI